MPSPEQQPEEKNASAFLVEQYELHIATYRVMSESAAEAIAKVLAGEAELLDNATEYVNICEDFGMTAAENEAITKELVERKVLEDPAIIPSIRSAQKAK